jgi:hypothetical protein
MIKLNATHLAVVAAAIVGLQGLPAPALADAAAPTPTPSPTVTPAPAAPYPCTNINADVTRPSASTSVCAVQPRHVVVETGYTNTTTTGVGANSTTNVPQAFIRTGIGPRIEFNFTPPSAESTNNGIATTSGTSDIGFGLKAVLGYSSRGLYGIGGSMTVPTGSAAFTNGANTYELTLNGSYSLTSSLSLFGTAGFASLVGTDANGNLARFGSFIPSVGVTYSLPSSWYVFVEGADFGKVAPNAGNRLLVDYGVQKASGRVQFDAEAGNALNVVNGSRYHYVGAGVSALFGKT